MTERAVQYTNLIKDVRDDYLNNPRKNSKIELKWCESETEKDLCQEINLWTYWQGWQYAKDEPEIKILLLGQDWGNPYNYNMETVKNIRKLNQGITDTQYLDNCDLTLREVTTDKNLVELFKSIGYPQIDKKRYSDLFFCNFSLGYRTGSQSGGMTGRVMNQDAPYIKKLIEIIKPEKILCLGQKTANATLKMLFGKVPRYKNYGSLVDSKKVYTYINGDVHSTVYPLFHTGFYGVRNRKGGLDKHFEDWSRIK